MLVVADMRFYKAMTPSLLRGVHLCLGALPTWVSVQSAWQTVSMQPEAVLSVDESAKLFLWHDM